MHNYDYLSVLIPTYNERDIIERTIKRVSNAVPNAEIIVIDDGSTDGTISVLENLNTPAFKFIKSGRNRGKGSAIIGGLKHVTRPIVVQIDADLQFLPEEMPDLIKPILTGKADIVFGSRYLNPKTIEKDSVSFLKKAASIATSILVSSICLKHYTDVFAGMKAWKSEVMQDIDLRINNFGYEAEIAITAKKKDYRVLEVPVTYKKRLSGESKIKFTRDVFVVCAAIFKTVFFKRYDSH